jgi:hypothetical protein
VVDSTGAEGGPDSSGWLTARLDSLTVAIAAAISVATSAATPEAASEAVAAVAFDSPEGALRSPAVAAAVSRGLPR